MKRRFFSNPPGIRLFIADWSEFIGGRWINHPYVNVDFTPDYETDDPVIIKAIRQSKGYGERYFEYDPETKRNTTFPVDYGLNESKPVAVENVIEDKPIAVRGNVKVK